MAGRGKNEPSTPYTALLLRLTLLHWELTTLHGERALLFFYGLLISPKLVGGHTVIRASPRIARRLVSDISPISYILRDWRKRIGRIKGGKEEERGTLEGDHPRRRNWEKTKIPLGIFYTARLPDALALLHCK